MKKPPDQGERAPTRSISSPPSLPFRTNAPPYLQPQKFRSIVSLLSVSSNPRILPSDPSDFPDPSPRHGIEAKNHRIQQIQEEDDSQTVESGQQICRTNSHVPSDPTTAESGRVDGGAGGTSRQGPPFRTRPAVRFWGSPHLSHLHPHRLNKGRGTRKTPSGMDIDRDLTTHQLSIRTHTLYYPLIISFTYYGTLVASANINFYTMSKSKLLLDNSITANLIYNCLLPNLDQTIVRSSRLPLSEYLRSSCALSRTFMMPKNPRSFKQALCDEQIDEYTDQNDQHLNEQKDHMSTTVHDESIEHSGPTEHVDLKTKEEQRTVSDYLQKLAKARKNIQQLKTTSLLAIVIGDQPDLSKLRVKLRNEWRYIKGEFTLVDRTNGWFDIRFSNPIDQRKIWEGRPYHVFGQLMLLRPWRANFDPSTENTQKVDMWIRIPFLPFEYINKDAIEIILHHNRMGEFIKLDPFSEKRMRVKYTRICISMDLTKGLVKTMEIPDENDKILEFPVWYEEFPKGCGNCGQLDHLFDKCPLRIFTPPKLQTFFRDESSPADSATTKQSPTSPSQQPWTAVHNKGKTHSHKGESSKQPNGKNQIHPNVSPNQLYGLSPTPAANTPLVIKENINPEQTKSKLTTTNLSKAEGKKPLNQEMGVPPLKAEKPMCAEKGKDILQNQNNNIIYEGSLDNSEVQKNLAFTSFILTEQEPMLQDKIDGFGEDDDLLLDEYEDYSEAEIAAFLVPDKECSLMESKLPSEGSFHSLLSSSSVVKKLEGMGVKKTELSTSGSSKRRGEERVDDTAASALKRPKTNP